MGRPILKGSTDVSTVIRIIDSTDGTPETGVTSATSELDLKYRREGAATANLTESDLSALTDAHSDGGILHIGAGYYRVDVPDAAFATGAAGVLIFGSVTGMIVIGEYHPLVNINDQDGVRAGLTALPAAAADAAGGLPISDAGGLDLDAKLANTNEVTPARMGALTDWIDGGRLDLILDIIAADTTTDIPATLTTIAAYLDTEIAAILEDTGTTLPAQISALNNISAAEVNAEVVDALATDTYAEPGQGAPAATTTLAAKINYLYKMMRNKKDQTATLFQLYADDASTVDQKSTVSNDGTTAVRGELASGP